VRTPCQLWILQDVLYCAFQNFISSVPPPDNPMRPSSITHLKDVTLVSS
jgi:hypothetical protein